MRVHVFIATTQGPIAVQRVLAEEPDVQSVICIDGGIEPLSISGRYHDFVRKGTGLIQRDFGQPAYRMDVSGRIDQGNSWQLPTYLAHFLGAQGLLGDGNPQTGDMVVWSTGALKADKSIIAVEEVFNKLTCSHPLFKQFWQQEIPLLVVVPGGDKAALERWQSDLDSQILMGGLYNSLAAEDLQTTLEALEGFLNKGESRTEFSMSPFGVPAINEPEAPPEPETEFATAAEPQPTRNRIRSLALVLAGLMLMGAAVAGGYLYFPSGFAAQQKVDMVVEMGNFPGDCNQKYVIERVLQADHGQFPEVALERLCALWLETSPNVKSIIGVALDTGALLPIQYSVDKWRIDLPKQKYRTREYALLALNIEYLDSVRETLLAELKSINAGKNGVDVEFLERFIKQQDYPGQVIQHRLVYHKKSAF